MLPETDVHFTINTSVYSVRYSRRKFRWSMFVRYCLVSGPMSDRTYNFVVALIVSAAVFNPIAHFLESDSVVHL